MDFKSQASLLNELLINYVSIWNREVMNEYPHTLNDYPKEWIADLDHLSTEELFMIDSKQSFVQLENSGLGHFIERIQKLSFVPQAEDATEIPLEDWAFSGVKFKKRHEIQKITPVIKKIYQQTHFHHINDIGGGVGHLARILAHYHSIPTYSIDQNSEFQEIGKKRLTRFRKKASAAEVTFINTKFGEDTNSILSKDSFTLGLHTCGNLAVKVIEENIKHKTLGLLNFGCCYYKMENENDFPISNFYKENKFQKINPYGLSLATRSHAETDFSNYIKKEKVKYYRYGFHLFMMKHFNRNDLIDVGECPINTYDKPFTNYMLLKLSEQKIAHDFSPEYIETFFSSKEIKRELRVMFLCNIIRWQLGRALEVFLLIDRCLYLEENGYRVRLEQHFKESLSPRNIGILALKD